MNVPGAGGLSGARLRLHCGQRGPDPARWAHLAALSPQTCGGTPGTGPQEVGPAAFWKGSPDWAGAMPEGSPGGTRPARKHVPLPSKPARLRPMAVLPRTGGKVKNGVGGTPTFWMSVMSASRMTLFLLEEPDLELSKHR